MGSNSRCLTMSHSWIFLYKQRKVNENRVLLRCQRPGTVWKWSNRNSKQCLWCELCRRKHQNSAELHEEHAAWQKQATRKGDCLSRQESGGQVECMGLSAVKRNFMWATCHLCLSTTIFKRKEKKQKKLFNNTLTYSYHFNLIERYWWDYTIFIC